MAESIAKERRIAELAMLKNSGPGCVDIEGFTNALSEDSRTSDQSAGLFGTQVSETTCGVTRFAKSLYDILTSSECEPALNAISSSSVNCSATYTPML